MLDFSKIHSGACALDLSPVEVVKTVRGLLLHHQPQASANGVILRSSVDRRGLPKLILTDSLKLTQLLNNLVSNAIKFTPKGNTVSISLFAVQMPPRTSSTALSDDTHDPKITTNLTTKTKLSSQSLSHTQSSVIMFETLEDYLSRKQKQAQPNKKKITKSLAFKVADTGCGIHAEKLHTIFSPFKQVLI